MRSFIAIAAIIAALSTNPVFADEVSGMEAVRIEINQHTKAFVFIIDDKPVAMLDKNGLYVAESIEYGGTLTDSETEHIRKRMASSSAEAADD